VFLFVLHQYPQLMNTSFELMIQGGFLFMWLHQLVYSVVFPELCF